MSKKNKPQDTAASADTAPAAPVIAPPSLPVVTPDSGPVPVGVLAVSVDPEAPPADAVTVEGVRAEDIARAHVTVNVTSRMDHEGVADVVREVLHRDAPAEVPLAAVDIGAVDRAQTALNAIVDILGIGFFGEGPLDPAEVEKRVVRLRKEHVSRSQHHIAACDLLRALSYAARFDIPEGYTAEDIKALTPQFVARMETLSRRVPNPGEPEIPPSVYQLTRVYEHNAMLSAALSAIATHVLFPPATHVHLNEPDALSLLIELVRATAEEFRAIVAALEPGAAERVTAGQWCAFLRSRHWIPAGEALQGAVLCYRREDCTVRVPTNGDPARTATLVDAIAVAERLPPTRVVALASLAG